MKEKDLINREINYPEKYNAERELDNWSRFIAIMICLTALFWFLFG